MSKVTDVFIAIVSVLITKLQLAPLVISEEETRIFDQETYWTQRLAIADFGDGVGFTISLQPKEKASECSYELNDQMRKIIAIILRRVGPVAISKRDIEFAMAARFDVHVEGRGEQGCTVTLLTTNEGGACA